MAGNGPSILVVASDRHQRALIVAMLREVGFVPVAAEEEQEAVRELERRRFAAAVVELPAERGIELMRAARRRQFGLPVLLVLEPAVMPLDDADCATLFKRPLDSRQLLGCVFELVLRKGEGHRTAPPREDAAEYGIAAAKRACLYRRLAAAAACGASRLAHDLSRQIGETAMPQDAAGTPRIGGLRRGFCAGAA